jgi:hypothetical protein
MSWPFLQPARAVSFCYIPTRSLPFWKGRDFIYRAVVGTARRNAFQVFQEVLAPGGDVAGAANELTSALIVNPYDRDEVAAALDKAITMPRTAATYSFATRFIPSRSGVTRPTSVRRKIFISSRRSKCWW